MCNFWEKAELEWSGKFRDVNLWGSGLVTAVWRNWGWKAINVAVCLCCFAFHQSAEKCLWCNKTSRSEDKSVPPSTAAGSISCKDIKISITSLPAGPQADSDYSYWDVNMTQNSEAFRFSLSKPPPPQKKKVHKINHTSSHNSKIFVLSYPQNCSFWRSFWITSTFMEKCVNKQFVVTFAENFEP